jgi:hypothetical protein
VHGSLLTNLFKPLGIPDVPASQWGSDPQGVTLGGWGLLLTPRELLHQYVIPAATSDIPLPANPEGMVRLESHVQAAARPVQPVPRLPEVAHRISGRTYTFEDNPVGWRTLRLTFQDGADVARHALNDDPREALTGLDNLYRVTRTPGLAMALRGHWENGDTFVLEYVMLDMLQEFEVRLTFTGDELDVVGDERVFGGMEQSIHGVLGD